MCITTKNQHNGISKLPNRWLQHDFKNVHNLHHGCTVLNNQSGHCGLLFWLSGSKGCLSEIDDSATKTEQTASAYSTTLVFLPLVWWHLPPDLALC